MNQASAADRFDEGEAHVRNRRTAVEAALVFHLNRDVFEQFFLILIEVQLVQDLPVPFQELVRRKAQGNASLFRMVFDQMFDRMQGAVHGAAVVIGIAVVLLNRAFLESRHMDGMVYEFINALVLCG